MDKKSSELKSKSKNWVSLNDFNQDPSFNKSKKNEFVEDIIDDIDVNSMSPVSRRKFIALMGASAAFAAVSCTDYKDKGEIVPYNKKPEEVLPGIANYYASTFNDGSGILIKTREGRPIKIDGNPDHPINKGKVPNFVQASILDLYDPERLKSPQKRSESDLILFRGEFIDESWKNIDKEIIGHLNKAVSSGKEIAIISHPIISPTAKKLIDDFTTKYTTSKLYTYNLFNDTSRRNAWMKCYGNSSIPSVKWNEPDYILAMESDFLGSDINATENIRLYTERRNIEAPENFNKLTLFEGGFSLTGLNADNRIRLNPIFHYDLVMCLINEALAKNPAYVIDNSVRAKVSSYRIDDFITKHNLPAQKVNNVLKELLYDRSNAFVYAGDLLPEATHIAVNLLNEIIGGKQYYKIEDSSIIFTEYSTSKDWDTLTGKMNSGEIGVVIHFDTNPVFHLTSDFRYSEALKKVPVVISMTEFANESSEFCRYLLPINHSLESWGDFQLRPSLVSLQQPVINSLYNSRQKEAILLNWLSDKPEEYKHDIYHQYLKSRWENDLYPLFGLGVNFQRFWYSALHDGIAIFEPEIQEFLPYSSESFTNVTYNNNAGKYTLLLTGNYTIQDGRYANNGWLQELPHPVSKIAWDNYAAISPSNAKELGLKNDDMIEVKNGNKSLKLPVLIQPGIADGVIQTELGYGRKIAGTIGSEIGFDTLKLCGNEDGISPYIYSNVTISKTGDTYNVVSTQEHHAIDDLSIKDMQFSRGIIKEGTVKEYLTDPDFLHDKTHDRLMGKDGKPISIVDDFEYPDLKWGMAIDLNKCVGCNLCVTACNVENNIPVVGKDQVMRGREMQWMRIDRYYTGTPDEPKANLQPMLCQHCDNAPCENVCPVVATTHSPDGLNQMVYNRCVGTRYCSNNCPYKVRRFNFYDFRDWFANGFYYNDSLKLAQNPEVTVRNRGVMEKCTFCIQRIMEARQEATKDGRVLKGSDVRTACQEACPSTAIVFGNLNDSESEVSKLMKHKLGYYVLELLNVRPNVTYLAKLRNINEEEA